MRRGSPRQSPLLRQRGLHVVATIVLILALVPTGLATNHAIDTDVGGTLTITLADPDLGGAEAGQAPLDVVVIADRMVEQHDGATVVRIPMLHAQSGARNLGPMDLRFFAPTGAETDGSYRTEEADDGRSMAIFEWTQNEPEIGSTVPDVRLELRQNVDLADVTILAWPTHGLGNVSVHLDLPATHHIDSNGNLTQRFHGVPEDRRIWDQVMTESTLSFVIQHENPTRNSSAQDRFPSYDPFPAAGWLIVIGLAVVSGGAWVLGHRLEARNQAPQEPGPPEPDADDQQARGKDGDP